MICLIYMPLGIQIAHAHGTTITYQLKFYFVLTILEYLRIYLATSTAIFVIIAHAGDIIACREMQGTNHTCLWTCHCKGLGNSNTILASSCKQ